MLVNLLLINKISKKDLAIVSNIEGTTRDVIEIDLDISGYPVILADTAGLRNSNDQIENEGIKRSIDRANKADLKIILIDGSKKNPEKEVAKFLDDNSIVVINKTDLIESKIPNHIEGYKAIHLSIKDDIGLDILIKEITDFTKNFFEKSDNTPLLTKQRYKENLLKCRECLKNIDLNTDIVLAAEELRMSAN
nr:50S ribosome-binding GTPase [Alphaproteobacteria bacterium]